MRHSLAEVADVAASFAALVGAELAGRQEKRSATVASAITNDLVPSLANMDAPARTLMTRV
jgi:hypothetical protein